MAGSVGKDGVGIKLSIAQSGFYYTIYRRPELPETG